MKDHIKQAIYLSIISSPKRNYMGDILKTDALNISKQLSCLNPKIQEIISSVYTDNTSYAVDKILDNCHERGIEIISIWDAEYPTLLREIENPPVVIYRKGGRLSTDMIAIVGTRKSNKISEGITRQISSLLAGAGFSIVSGMAVGIDRSAHIGALGTNGSTTAVMPGGLDRIYPASNCDLYEKIVRTDNSNLISEYPPGISAGHKWTFVRRNRIISGISKAVIITHAPLKSGAMITARFALEQNRELFVCPGEIFNMQYSGNHELIRQGAHIVFNIDDILLELNSPIIKDEKNSHLNIKGKPDEPTEIKSRFMDNGIDARLIRDLTSGNINIDTFIRGSEFSPEDVARVIVELELSECIYRRGNILYKGRKFKET